MNESEKLLSQLRGKEGDKIDGALDILFRQMDDWFHAGEFATADAMLQEIKPEEYGITLLVGFLATSNWARDHLPSRPDLYKRIKSHLEQIEPPDRVHRLIFNLE